LEDGLLLVIVIFTHIKTLNIVELVIVDSFVYFRVGVLDFTRDLLLRGFIVWGGIVIWGCGAVPNTLGIPPKVLLNISAPPSSTSSIAVPLALIVSANTSPEPGYYIF